MRKRRWISNVVLPGTIALGFALVSALATVSCDRTSSTPTNDTARLAGPPPDDSTLPELRNAGWDDRDGPALLVVGATPSEARVVLPAEMDASTGRQPSSTLSVVTLISREGRLSRAGVLAVSPHLDSQCVAWPSATLRDTAGSTIAAWNVGLAGTMLTALPLDSVAAFSHADSTRLATEIARVVSALKDDTLASFRGLPVVVREMRRFRPAPNIEAIVADVARRLATEANPREERVFLIAERAEGGPLLPRYWSRASGPEDVVESGDPLAAVRFADGRVGMLVALESASTRYVLLRRDNRGQWHVQWRSAETDC